MLIIVETILYPNLAAFKANRDVTTKEPQDMMMTEASLVWLAM